MTAIATRYTAGESTHEAALAFLAFWTGGAGWGVAVWIVGIVRRRGLIVGALLRELVVGWVVAAAVVLWGLGLVLVVTVLWLAVLWLIVLWLAILRLLVVVTAERWLLAVVEAALVGRSV